ncbi:peptidylprolyl isomerase PrsA family protein [Lachnoanaerobaculum umeaense]|nr:hypothetical protein [Lachnoanaerobaculum umeaense]PZW98314.1 hypothetical protein C7439_10641 [Lachnoanaerobaculum umeaense]
MKRKVLVGFIMAICISGCGIKTENISENIKINFTDNKLGYNYGQMLIVAASENKIITNTYSEAIWDCYIDRENNITYRDNFYNDLKNYYKELVVLKKIADKNEITLSEQEKAKALKLSKTFYDENLVNREDFSGLSQEDCDKVFLDYFLVNKAKKDLLEKNVKEVSDSEARIMEFHVIEVSDFDLANSLLERLNNGENCVKLATQFSESDSISRSIALDTEPDEIKNSLGVLEDGGVSPILTNKGKYVLYKCVKSYNEEATKKNKQRIKDERESAYLLNLYNEFIQENPVEINESELKNVCENSSVTLSGRDFFTLWSEEENGGI